MDLEDREHFKTIAVASALPPTALPIKSDRLTTVARSSNSRPDPAFCLEKAKTISGCYRRDEAHDPDTFVKALAVVLGDYPVSIIEFAADPRTGVVTRFPMGLPNVGQVKEFLDATQAKQAQLESYAKLPKVRPSGIAPPPKLAPNMFVPSDNRHFDRLSGLHKKTQGERSHFANNVCHDGKSRYGIWVPLDWYQSPSAGEGEV